MYRKPEAAVASRHPHTAGWLIRQSTKLRFNDKMGCLLILVLICTLLGNLDAAFNTRDAIRGSIDAGLIDQVTGVHQLLQQELQHCRSQEQLLSDHLGI